MADSGRYTVIELKEAMELFQELLEEEQKAIENSKAASQ
jgi:hypothetical protein